MKKFKAVVIAAAVITALLATSFPAFAYSENESRCAQNFFIEAKLLKGDGSSYGLEKVPTRMEGVIILIRLLGKEAEAQKLQSQPCQFLDVPAWAVGYANYAYAESISKGVSDTRFGTNDVMTAQQYHTLLLRTIGYNDNLGDFRWDNAVDKAEDLGILPSDLAERFEDSTSFSKRDLVDTSFCFLEAKYNNQETTMIGELTDSGVISDELAQEYGLGVEHWDTISTSVGGNEVFHFDLEDEVLTITGSSDDEKKEWILVQIVNKETGSKKTDKVDNRDSEGKYKLSISVASLPKGEYFVDLYSNDEKYNYYTSFILSSLVLEATGSDAYFSVPPVYKENLRAFKGNTVEQKDESMTLLTRADKDAIGRIRELSAEITQNCSNDYEKVLAIHDWVADYVYYDQDFLEGEKDSSNLDSASVLDNRFAVCSGYSNLTKDLISAAGIPCKLVYGYALGVEEEEDDWSDVNLNRLEANHVWNEAYVDGRWVILDTTWDSSNSYDNGDFEEGDSISHIYFDSTAEFFSNTHKSMLDVML